MKNRTLFRGLLAVLAVVLFAALFLFATRLLSPKYAETLTEGSMISQYYQESGGHEVIFVGDCEVYANFSPMEMYRQDGITAYVRGSPHQLLWQSYYILEETLSYEIPDVVVFNISAMQYSEPVSEEYNRLTIDRMRWSSSKVGIIRASMTEEESFWSYVFPILRYHSRFSELTNEDISYLFRNEYSTYNGFQMNKGVDPVVNLPAMRIQPDYQFKQICYDYLDQMRELCDSKGVTLLLVKAPSVYPYWYDEYDEQIRTYADTYGLDYFNFQDVSDEIGIDYSTDTYDAGMHLNVYGATKLSRYFADILAGQYGLADCRDDPAVSEVYNSKLEQYDRAAEI